ncbi:MAG: LysM peptidoglycan-binding domain-containing protein [Anaerolineae bacterium]
MTRQQAIFILVLNAFISLLIAVLVVFVSGRLGAGQPVGVAEVGATIMPTTTPSGAGRLITHTVKPGETLTSISLKYGVSVEAIMLANGLTNPDVLGVGQELIIPWQGFTPASASPTSPPPTFGPPQVHIVAILLNTLDRKSTGEMVIVTNSGGQMNLKDWSLSDDDGNVYTFPDFVLGSGGTVRVHTESGKNGGADLYWGRALGVWDPGDLVVLTDDQGVIVDTYEIKR